MSEHLWENTEARVQLPISLLATYFDKSGAQPHYQDSSRGYHRFFYRVKAVLTRGTLRLGIYTMDVSRTGVGIMSPVQLFPLERLTLELPSGNSFVIETRRCSRVNAQCYYCGARFAASQ